MSRTNSNSATAGGPVCEGIPGTFQRSLDIRYQPTALELANRRQEFRDVMAAHARNLRRFAITATERSRCDEVIRGRSLSHDGLMTLLDLAARSDSPRVWEEFCRSEGIKRVAQPLPLCVFEASEAEQEANAELDMAQLVAAKERTPVRWEAVRTFAQQQYEATRRLIDAASSHLARVKA